MKSESALSARIYIVYNRTCRRAQQKNLDENRAFLSSSPVIPLYQMKFGTVAASILLFKSNKEDATHRWEYVNFVCFPQSTITSTQHHHIGELTG